MQKNVRSLILILILIAIVLFLTGFRLGKAIERVDKSYVPPPTPTAQPDISTSPTQPAIAFNTYVHEECGVSFLVPSALKENQTSSNEARFGNDMQYIYISCDEDVVSTAQKELNEREESNTKTIASKKVKIYDGDEHEKVWIIPHPKKKHDILFNVHETLFELMTSSLK